MTYDTQGLIASLSTWKAGATSADETLTLAYDSNRRLTQVSTSTRGTDGSLRTQTRVAYSYDSAGRLAGVITDLSPEDNSTADGRTYTVTYGYDGAGRLRTLAQTDGSALTIDYDDAGRVRRITDALGRATTFGYDTAARQTSVTDALGQVARLAYDSAGRLGELSGTGFKTRFEYDNEGNLLSSTNGLGQQTLFGYDGRGNLIRSTDASGRVLERSFDAANRQISQTQYAQPGVGQTTRYVYDTSDGLRRLRFAISAEGRVTEQQYNTLGQVGSSIAYTRSAYGGAATLADLTAWAGQQTGAQRTDYSYDLRGQLASRSDAAGLTRYTYDPFGRLLQSIDANGNTTAYAYDGLDRLVLSTDAQGAVTTTSYDDAGYRTSVLEANGLRTVSTYNTVGLLVAQTQYNGSTALGETRYTYDAANRLRMTQGPTGQRQWMLYDEAGRLVGEVDALGHLSEYRYDAAGRLVQTIGYEQPVNTALLLDAQGQPANVSLAAIRPAPSANDRRQWQLFDAAGRLTHQVNGLGEVAETQYDGAGRIATVIQHGQRLAALPATGSNDLPVLAYAATGDPDRSTRSLYDADGLLRGTLDAEGTLTEMRYDAAGHLVERIAYATPTDPAQRSAGTLAQFIPTASAADRRSVWLYDSLGRQVAEIDPDGWLTETSYNAAGQRSQSLRHARRISGSATPASTVAALRPAVSTQDQRTAWTYDALNRVSTETAADGTVTRYGYDNAGNLTSTERATGTTEARRRTQRYDLQGRLVAELSGEGSARLDQATTQAQIDAVWSTYATQHAYDAAGRRIRSTDARGSTTVYYYDAVGRLAYTILKTDRGGEVQASRYNGFGETTTSIRYTRRLSTADTAALTGGQADAALDARIAALADGSEARTQASYNQRGLIQQAIDALGFKTTSSYDAFGQLSRSEAETGDGRVLRTDYSRDRRGLLTATVQDPLGLAVQTRTEYDAFGRVTASVDARGYRSTTQYLASDGTPDSGRQVVLTGPTGANSRITYDAFDRVIRQTDALGQTISVHHDPANRRVTMTSAQGVQTVTETNRHGQSVRVTDGTGAATLHTYDLDGNLLTSTDALGNVTSSTYDRAGNRVTLSTPGGAVQTRYEYDAANRLLVQTVDPDGLRLQTTYEYDGQGRRVRVTDATGTVTSYAFNARGDLQDMTLDDRPGGLQLKTRTTYDAQGRILRVTEGADSAAAKTTEYRYDLLGRRTHEIIDPAGLQLTTRYEYDAAGNVILKRDAQGHGTRYVHDAAGRLVVTLNAAGEATEQVYDAEGRLKASKAYARRIGDNDALRVWYQAGTNSSVSRSLGSFQAGDVVTATVRFKSDRPISGAMFLGDAGGADPYDNSQYTGAVYGRPDGDGWQTLTLTHTMAHADSMWVYLYGDRDGANAQAGHSVLYDWVRVTSSQRGTVLDEGFEGSATYGGNTVGSPGTDWSLSSVLAERVQADAMLDPAQLSDAQILASVATLADTARDQVTQWAYDQDGRLLYAIDALGGVTRYIRDHAGRVVETIRHAIPNTGTWLATSAPTADPRDQRTSTVYDAAGRVRYTVDALGYVNESVHDAAGRIVAAKRYANAITRPPQMDEAGVAAALAGQLDATRDRTEYLAYDAAGRQRFRVDAEGHVTEQQFDALGRVVRTYRHAAKLNLGTVPTEAELVAATTYTNPFDVSVPGFTGPADVWDDGRLKLVSRPEAGGGWAMSRGIRTLGVGSAIKFDLRPMHLQQALHAGVDSSGIADSPFGRLVALLQPDGHIYAQVYAGTEGRSVDLGTYVPGTTYTVEITTSDAAATLYFYEKGKSRETGYLYRTDTALPWTGLSTVFYISRHPTLQGETTTFIDNLEERSAAVTSHSYDAAGRLVRSVDAEGGVTRHAYDELGRETERTTAYGRPEARTTTWSYDAAGRKLTETLAAGTEAASSTRFRYDANGRLIFKIDPRGVALMKQNTAWASAERQALGYAADAAALSAADQTALAQRYTTRYGHDATGRLTTVIDAAGGVIMQRYDGLGNALRTRDARGLTTYTTYDKLNRAVQQVDAEGYLTANSYDAFGNLVTTQRYAGRVVRPEDGGVTLVPSGGAIPPTGAYLVEDPSQTRRSSFEYTRLNQRSRSVDAEGHAESSTFDAFGNAATSTNKLGGTAVFQYDRLGRLVQETLPVQARRADGTLVPVVTQHQYDSRGNRIQTIEAVGLPEQRTTQYRFDALDRLVQTIGMAYTAVDAAGNTSTVVPVDVNRYDARGNVIEQIQHANLVNGTAVGGRRSLAWYDALGRKTAEVSADAVLAEFGYDVAGNLLRQTIRATRLAALPAVAGAGSPPPSVAASADDRTLRFSYDALGRKTQTRLDGAWTWEDGQPLNGPQTLTLETLRHDAAGNVVQRTDARGNSSFSWYDGLGRKRLAIDAAGYATAWDYAGPGSTATQETRYARAVPLAYDAGSDPQALRNALAAQAEDPNERNRVTVFVLDRLDRVTSRQVQMVAYEHVQADGSRVARIAHATTFYSYDGLGHVTQIQERVAELADNATNIWQITDIAYDQLGRETSRQAPGYTDHEGQAVRPRSETQYDGLGRTQRAIQRGRDNGTEADDRITRYSYGVHGQLSELVDAEGGITRNAYDALGNVSRQTRVAVRKSDGSTRDLVKTWQYDASGRITVETDLDTGEVRQTRYNAFGEVAAKGLNGGWQEWAEYTTLGKVWKTNTGDGAVKLYLHDANGNTTREIRAGVGDDGAGSMRDLGALTLAQVSSDTSLLHTVSLYDKRNLLIRTLDPRISLTGSTITLKQQFTPLWVPQWGDLNVNTTSGGAYAQAGVGQGAAYTTVTTSSGSATQLGGGAPAISSDGVDVGSASTGKALGSGATPRFSPLVFSPSTVFRKSTVPSNLTVQLSLPSDWPAGPYRITQTVEGSGTSVLTSTAQPGSSFAVGKGGTNFSFLIEWLPATAGTTSIAVAQATLQKEVEFEPGFQGAWFYGNVTAQPGKRLLIDTDSWNATATAVAGVETKIRFFKVIVDAQQTQGPGFMAAPAASPLGDGSTWPPAVSGFVGFDLASPTAPTLAAGLHTVQIVGFTTEGKLVAGRNYTINGNDISTFTEVPGDAGLVYLGSAGNAWAQTTRNAANQVTSTSLSWELGSGSNTSGTFRWRIAGAAGSWGAVTFSSGHVPMGAGTVLALADGTYEYVIDHSSGLRYGTFTVTAGAVAVSGSPARLQPVTLGPERITITGPIDAQGRGKVQLVVQGGVFEASTDANGQAQFDVAEIRRYLGIDRWSVSSWSYAYTGFVQHANGTRQVTHSERGTLSLNPRFDNVANSFSVGTDTIPEYRPEGLVTLPGASGSITIGVGSSTPVTLPVDGSDWRVQRSGSNLVLNLGAWKPAWGAAEQSVSWQYTGTDGLVASGSFAVAYDGTVRSVGTVTQRTRQPVLPLSIPGAVTLQAFLVGANGATPTQVPSGEITGSGPNFTWNASSRLGQTLRYEYTALDSAGQLVGRGRGQLVVDVSGAITHTPDAPVRTPALLRLAPPAGTTGLVVEARRAGTSDAFVTLPVQALEGNTRVYSVEGYVPGSGTTTLEYRFTASGSAGVLSKGSGQLSIQANGTTSGSAIEEYRPVIVSFKIVGRNVPQAQLAVPGVGNVTLPGTWVPPVAPSDKSPGELGYTRFDWDAAAYGATSGVRTYDYTLTAQSAGSATLQDELGRPLVQTGRIALDPTSARPVQLLQQIQTFTQDSEIVVSRSQAYNAFGEVVEERDDRVAERMQAMLGGRALTADEQAAARTTLRYNTLGKLVAKIDPQTSITLANGYTYRDRPTTSYGYDLLGRLATSTDANGNLTRQALLAGGQPGQERVAAQWHADGGVRSTAYDIFGDARRITDEENHVIQQGYDKLGRLVQVDRLGIQRVDGSGNAQAAATLGERYSYDQLGQRLTRTDALGQVMRTDYDGLGRITSTRTANGFETRYQYQLATVTVLNGAAAAGYKKTTFEVDGRSRIDQIDYFGHTTWHRDLGGTEYTYNYDAAARLVRQTSTVHTGQSKGQDIRYTYYANGYIQSATDVSAGTRSEYGYDAAGNRVSEGYYQWDGSARIASYQNATITYDELNRVARVQDVNYFDIRYEYDAVGNRRLVDSVYWDGVAGLRNKQVYWYAYDQMNRFTVTKGTLSGARATSKADTSTSVIAGTEGTTLGYDKLGQRRMADYTYKGALIHEVYGYSQDGYLQTIAQGGTLKDVRVLDALGRTKEQHDKQNQTLTVSTYDADNRLLSQRHTDAKDGNKNHTTAYSYYTDTSNTGSSQAGAGALAKTVTTPDSGSATTTTYTYDYWDEAKQKLIDKTGPTGPGQTRLSYNANGHLLSAFDTVARLTTSYFNSANGLILKRERQQVNGSGVTKVGSHFYYYADGKRVGDVSDDPNDDPRLSYAEALARKAQDPQDKKDLYKNFKPVTSADFDQNYEPINDSYPGAVGGTYTVRGGETLQAVAQTLWGDGSQWYLIAEANGLIGLENLSEGQVLVIPNKVTNIHNNSSTVRPYSAGEAIGNIDPTLPAPPPPPKHGCGAIGMVLMIVVAVVVTIYTAGAAAGYLGAASTAAGATGSAAIGGAALSGGGLMAGAGGFALGSSAATAVASAAIGGAVGSIASQGLAIAMNMQDKFSWKAVGQAALGGAITAGVGLAVNAASSSLSALQGSGAWASAGRAALSSGVNQALHGDWNWQEVMASAVGAGAGAAAGNALQGSFLGSVGSRLAAGFAGGVVGQWAGPGGKARYSSVFASTLGNVLGQGLVDAIDSDRDLSNGNYRNEMDRESDAYSPVFNYNYRSGSDVESDIAYEVRRSRYTGGDAFAADVAARRAGSASRQIDELIASVGSDGVSVDSSPGSIYVQPGDNLTKIAARWAGEGASAAAINDLKNRFAAANPQLADFNRLDIGSELSFPGADTSVDRSTMARLMAADQHYQYSRLSRMLAAAGPRGGAGLGYDYGTTDVDQMMAVAGPRGGSGAGYDWAAPDAAERAALLLRANSMPSQKDLTRDDIFAMRRDLSRALRATDDPKERLYIQGAFLSVNQAAGQSRLLSPGEVMDGPGNMGLALASGAFGGSNGAVPSGISPAQRYGGPSFRSAFRAFEFDNEPHNAADFVRYRQVMATTEAANSLVESLQTTGALPLNFVTKQQAALAGWQPGKALGNHVPGGQIGGDEFLNTTAVVPPAPGRTWYEADVGLVSTMKRSSQPGTRLLYSNDGLLYVTPDHYQTAYPIGRWKQ